MNFRTALLATSMSATALATSYFDTGIRLEEVLAPRSVVYRQHALPLDASYGQNVLLASQPYIPPKPAPEAPRPYEAILPDRLQVARPRQEKRRRDPDGGDLDFPIAPHAGRRSFYRRMS